MVCQRCGKEILESANICPACGTAIVTSQAGRQAPGGIPYPQGILVEANEVETSPLLSQTSPRFQEQFLLQLAYAEKDLEAVTLRVPHDETYKTSKNRNDRWMLVEIVFSLFGIFGVGWLLAGEVVTGVILLLCSIIIYWPLMIMGTFFTIGLGLICLGPLGIGAIIVNALLFSALLRRKQITS